MKRDKPPDVMYTHPDDKIYTRDEIIQRFTPILRKIKIKSLSGDYRPEIYTNNYNPCKINVLKELSKIGIITGSTALRLYGYISRDTADIDLIVTPDVFEKLKLKFEILGNDLYHKSIDIDSKGYIKYGSYIVDIFVKLETDIGKYEEFDNIKLSNPLLIIEKKLELSKNRYKDIYDFNSIEYCIKNNKFYNLRLDKVKKTFSFIHKILLLLKFQPSKLDRFS